MENVACICGEDDDSSKQACEHSTDEVAEVAEQPSDDEEHAEALARLERPVFVDLRVLVSAEESPRAIPRVCAPEANRR